MIEQAAANKTRGRVLVVDDEPEILAALTRQLRREFDVYTAEGPELGYGVLDQQPVEVIVSDQRMPGISGTEFLAHVRQTNPRVIRLMLTGYADMQAVIDAVNKGQIYRYVTKPWDPTEIRTIVREALDRFRLLETNDRLVSELREANTSLELRVEARTKALAESERRYRTIVEGTTDPVMLTDAQGVIVAVNPAFIRVTGYSTEEILGKSPDILRSGRHPDGFYEAIAHSLKEDGRWRGLVWNRNREGGIYVQQLTLTCVTDQAGKVANVVYMYSDVDTELDELDRVWADAQHDPLTGLPNRRLLFDRLKTALCTAERYEHRLAILFVDLDGFKPINDQLGHATGDHVLQETARRMRSAVRKADTVARIGGDEFLLVLDQVNSRADAKILANKLVDLISAPLVTDQGHLCVGASVGISLYPEDAVDAEKLLAIADASMYEVKRGRKQQADE